MLKSLSHSLLPFIFFDTTENVGSLISHSSRIQKVVVKVFLVNKRSEWNEIESKLPSF
jgi:hypothetical protein